MICQFRFPVNVLKRVGVFECLRACLGNMRTHMQAHTRTRTQTHIGGKQRVCFPTSSTAHNENIQGRLLTVEYSAIAA